ncbi:MAG: RNA polymerase sigma factor [Pirellulaceae bacterium]
MSDRENELIARINEGDQDAMAEYLQFRRGDLLAVILNKMGMALRNKIEADDIYQEVAAGAVQNMNELDFSERGPFGWLCEMAQRRIVDAERKFSAQKRAKHREVGIHGSPEQSQVGLVNLLVASITSPSQAFSRNQKEFKLIHAMEQMPEDQRRVLHMRYGEGRPTKEIAESIGKTDGATRVLLTRALKKLKDMVEET